MVQRIPALSAPVSFFSYTGQLCHVLQYACSVFGLVVLAIWFALLPPPAPAPGNGERFPGGPALLAALFVAAAALGGFATVRQTGWHPAPAYRLFYLLLTRTTACFAALYTLAGIVIVAGRRRASAASVTQVYEASAPAQRGAAMRGAIASGMGSQEYNSLVRTKASRKEDITLSCVWYWRIGPQLARLLARLELEGGEPEAAAPGRLAERPLRPQPAGARPEGAAVHDPEARGAQLVAAAQHLQCHYARGAMIGVCIQRARREHQCRPHAVEHAREVPFQALAAVGMPGGERIGIRHAHARR